MPDPNTDAEAKLQKLGQRLRVGFAKRHPAQHLETVRDALREQYEREQVAKRGEKSPENSAKPGRQPTEPDHERYA
jgi:hypothetical protein